MNRPRMVLEPAIQGGTLKLILSCRAQWRLAIPVRTTPVTWVHVILVHNQPEPAVFVLGNVQLLILLRRFTSESLPCYLGHLNEEGLSISMRKIQETRNVQAAPIQET